MRKSKLVVQQLDKRTNRVRNIVQDMTVPSRGWVQAIRTALGMTTAQFAKRAGMTQSGAVRLEESEQHGVISLATLRKAAEALDCTLVYALVPNDRLDETINRRARGYALAHMQSVNHTMLLEAQDTDADAVRHEVERLTEQLLDGKLSRIWETE